MTNAINGRRARPMVRCPKCPQSTCACSPNRKRLVTERTVQKLRYFNAFWQLYFALRACGILGDGLVRGGFPHVYSNIDRRSVNRETANSSESRGVFALDTAVVSDACTSLPG